MALWHMTEFVEGLLRLISLVWRLPDFSTLCRCQKTLAVRLPHCGSEGPPHFLIDSTGLELAGELGECNARRHGGLKRRVWR